MWRRRRTERVRTVSLSSFTSVLAMVCLLWVLFCVWFVFCWCGCLLAVVGFLVFACAPYPPLYISYEDSSHSEMGT